MEAPQRWHRRDSGTTCVVVTESDAAQWQGDYSREHTKPPWDGCGGFTEACAACWDRQVFTGTISLRPGRQEVESPAQEMGPVLPGFAMRSARLCWGPGWAALASAWAVRGSPSVPEWAW